MSCWHNLRNPFAAFCFTIAVAWVATHAAPGPGGATRDGGGKRNTASAAGRIADPAYYMTVFAYDTMPRAPQTAHTFATFIKSDGLTVQTRAISWFPKSNTVRLLAPPEEGVNLDLKQTLANAAAVQAKVHQWGPYRIKPELYERAIKQITRLESGKVMYKAIDVRFRPAVASSCMHAVSDIDMDDGPLLTGTAYGVEASTMVMEHLQRWLIPDTRRDPSIAQALHLPSDVVTHE